MWDGDTRSRPRQAKNACLCRSTLLHGEFSVSDTKHSDDDDCEVFALSAATQIYTNSPPLTVAKTWTYTFINIDNMRPNRNQSYKMSWTVKRLAVENSRSRRNRDLLETYKQIGRLKLANIKESHCSSNTGRRSPNATSSKLPLSSSYLKPRETRTAKTTELMLTGSEKTRWPIMMCRRTYAGFHQFIILQHIRTISERLFSGYTLQDISW